MPVYLDVKPQLDARAAEAAAREVTRIFDGVGRGINKGLGASLTDAFKSFRTDSARAEIDLLRAKVLEASDAEFLLAQKAEAASVRSVAAWRAAAAAVDKYTASSAQAMKATAGAIDATAVATVATNKHAKSVDDAAAAHNKLDAAAAGSVGALGRFQGAATLAAGAVVGGFVAGAVDATKAAGDFQVQLTRLNTVAGEAPRNLKLIHDGLMSLASETGWNPTELANGMLTVEQAGYRGADALKVMGTAAKAASEEHVSLGEAANAVTTALKDYHLPLDQAADVTSKLIEATGHSKTTFSEFTGSLHNVIPTASAVGESLNDLLATMAMLTQSGMHPDQASQNLNHALSSLGNIQPKQREMLASLGLDPRQVPKDLQTQGYIGTAQEIRSAVDRRLGPNGNVVLDAFENNPASQALEHEQYDKLSPAEKAVADRIMQGQLSQKEFRKSRGGLGVTESKIVDAWLNTHENNQGFNRVLKSLNTDQLGVMQALQTAVGGQDNARTLLQVTDQNNPQAMKDRQDIAAARADANGDPQGYRTSQQNFNAQWKDLKASVDALKIEFGEDFLPTATQWVKSLETGVHWMQQHKALVKDLVEDATVLSGLFLGMKLSTGLVNSVKDFRAAFGLTKKAVDETNTSMRESAPAAKAGATGVKAATDEEAAAQQRVKTAVYQANQELRNSGAAAQAGAGGVKAATDEEVTAENRVKEAVYQANAELRGAGAAAEAGAAGVTAAATEEVGAMNRVMGAANRAKGALAAVGGMALSMGGDALQDNTRHGTAPNKWGVVASDAGNMALAGGAVASIIPGVGTGVGAAVGGALGAGYGIFDQFFSGDNDGPSAPDTTTPDMGPVPVVPQPDTTPPTPDVAPPIPDITPPETPDMPYAGGGGGGGGGKKPKDDDPLDKDLKDIERLQTEANEIQARIADDKASNDPARRGEIPWLQKKLDEIGRQLAGISGEGKSGSGSGGSGSPFMPVKLDDNWLQGGLPSLVRNTVGFLEDLVLGPLEVAAFHGIPPFEGAGGKSGRHSRRSSTGVRRSHEEGLGAEPGEEGPGGALGGIPGVLPGTRGAESGVVPVFITNWASGGPGALGGGGLSAGTGAAAGTFGGGGLSASSGGGAGGLGGGLGAPPGPGDEAPNLGAPVSNGGPYTGQDAELADALKAKGFTDSQITGLLALNRVETGNWSHPESIMGFTNNQTGPGIAAHVGGFKEMWDRRQRTGAVPGAGMPGTGLDAQGNVTDPNAYARWLLKLEGYSSTTDAAGNHYPPGMFMSDDTYANSVARAYKPAPSGSRSPAPSASPAGPGRFTPDWATPYGIKGPMAGFGLTDPGAPHPAPPAPGTPPVPRDWRDLIMPGAPTPSSPAPASRATGPLILPGYTGGQAPWIPGFTPGFALGGSSNSFPGGPKGNDYIPAWLGDDEWVEPKPAVDFYGPSFMDAIRNQQVDPSSVRYFDPGGPTTPQPQPSQPPQPQGAQGPKSISPSQNMLTRPGPGGQQKPGAAPEPPKPDVGEPIPPPQGPTATGMGVPDIHNDRSNLAVPGGDVQQPGAGLPTSPGIGFSGGIIGSAEGAAEGAASAAANMFAPGSGAAASSAMSIGFQELNRAASFGAQATGILTEGALETIIPDSSSTGGDFMKTIPGRLLAGVAGVRPASDNTAGQTQQPGQGGQNGTGGYANVTGGDQFHINGDVHVNSNQPDDFVQQMQQKAREEAMAFYAYPNSLPLGGGVR